MNKNETVQMNLDEEQVQDVIGGCNICTRVDPLIRRVDVVIATASDDMMKEIRAGNHAGGALLARTRKEALESRDVLKATKERAKITNPGPHT